MPDHEYWESLYSAALLELDREKLPFLLRARRKPFNNGSYLWPLVPIITRNGGRWKTLYRICACCGRRNWRKTRPDQTDARHKTIVAPASLRRVDKRKSSDTFFLIFTERTFQDPVAGVYSRTVQLRTGDSPMKKTAEIVITTLMLGALYFWSPVSSSSHHNRNSVISNSTSGDLLMIADGTDPMPGKKR